MERGERGMHVLVGVKLHWIEACPDADIIHELESARREQTLHRPLHTTLAVDTTTAAATAVACSALTYLVNMERARSFAAGIVAGVAATRRFSTTPPPPPPPACEVVLSPPVTPYSGLSCALAAGIIVVVTVISTLLISGHPRTTQLATSCITAVVVFLVEPALLPALNILFRSVHGLLLPAIEATMARLKSMRFWTNTTQPASLRGNQLGDGKNWVHSKHGEIQNEGVQDWMLVGREDSVHLKQGKIQSEGEPDWTLIGSTKSMTK
ncbi:hypothetical protein AC578_4033 [Pseudocercospora eumusae]|uniref:Uncharacterized protein n=1 Tax=Pseudocercospora eumusae TaxID=321146 RepID=A0A139HE28_9PEZI|nr:hypothetical protein AC578_4033 [Pseudocercospora eumusae]